MVTVLPTTHDPVLFSSPAFPLHLSAPALRILLDHPREEAMAVLERSREHHGWEQPTAAVPADTGELLDTAASLLVDDCLILNTWSSPTVVTAALPLELPNQSPTCLTIGGPAGMAATSQIARWLHTHGERVVASLTD